MSFWGNLLKIVAIGAFFAAGPLGGIASATIRGALQIAGAVLGYLGALIDKPRLLNERQLLFVSTTLEPGTPLPVVYGRAKVGAIVADWFIQPINNFKELYYIAAFAHASRDGLGVAGVDEIWFDQRKAIDVVTPARFYPYKPIAANYKVFLGSTTQNVGGTKLFSGTGSSGSIVEPGNVSSSGWSLTTDLGQGVVVVGFVFVNVDTATFNETTKSISSNSAANPTVVTTSAAHGFSDGDSVRIANHTGSTPSINGDWVATVISPTTFSIPQIVTVGGGASGTVKRFSEGPVFHGPPSVAIIVRGNRIYDYRTDTWMAGGDNPAMCIRDYLLAPIYGCGFDPTLIHEQSFSDAADYCDTLVKHVVSAPVTVTSSSVANPSVITATAHGFGTSGTFMVRIAGHSGSTPSINADYTATYVSANSFSIPVNVTVGGSGGTVVKLVQIKRHTCNGVVDTARATSDNLQELLSSCRGNLVWEQGQFKLTIRSEIVASPTITLSPSNIIGEWSFRNAGLEEKWNSVTATYIEPANGEFKTQDVQWPLVGTTNSYLASDGAFTNRLQLSLPFTNDQLMAQMLAQVTLNEARLGISCSVRCTEEVLAASVGDRVYVTHPTPGWTLKQFWVTALQLMPDTTVVVSLQEYDSTAYDLGTMEDRRSFPATTLDSVFSVPVPGAVTTVYLAGGGMKISWGSAAYGLIDFYEVQARLTSAGEDYVTIERVRESGVLQAVAPLARPGQLWDARVRVVNVAGWPSEWVDAAQLSIAVPGAVTPGVGSLIWTGFAPTITIVPSSPTLNSVGRTESGGDLCNDLTNWINVPSWNVTGANDTYFQTDIDVASDAAGVTFLALTTGLTTATSSYNHDTGIKVKLDPPGTTTTYYRKYRIKIVRKSDSAVVATADTTQGTIIKRSGLCGP